MNYFLSIPTHLDFTLQALFVLSAACCLRSFLFMKVKIADKLMRPEVHGRGGIGSKCDLIRWNSLTSHLGFTHKSIGGSGELSFQEPGTAPTGCSLFYFGVSPVSITNSLHRGLTSHLLILACLSFSPTLSLWLATFRIQLMPLF